MFSLQEIKKHCSKHDCWIVVNGKVYDITSHIYSLHIAPNSQATTILSILAHAGSDCSSEFHQIHRHIPQAYRMLNHFYIGEFFDGKK